MSDRVHDWYEIAFGAGPMIGELSEQTYDNIGLDLESHKSATWQGRFQTYRPPSLSPHGRGGDGGVVFLPGAVPV